MKAARIFLFLGLTTLGANAFSQTVYTSGNFSAPCNSAGKDCQYALEVELDLKESKVGEKTIGIVEGKVLEFYGVRSCQWRNQPVKGTVNANGVMRWRSEGEIQGCTRIVFEGKKDGENLVGAILSFQKTRVELVLKPKK